MNVKVNYTGSPGSISASVTVDGKPIDSTTVKTHREAVRWAKGVAREYKKEQTIPLAPRRHDVFITVSGEKSFII